MAQGINIPEDTRAVESGGAFNRVWVHFFGAVARKLNNSSQVALVTTANASDLASAIALANNLKTQLNALITAQQS